MSKSYVVDENGVVLQELDDTKNIAILEYGDKVVRKDARNYLSDSVDIKYRFIKINPLAFNKYCKKYSILPTLITTISYMDNICSYSNGKIIQIKDLHKVCGVSEITVKRQLKGLIEDDIVHKVSYDKKQKCLIVNPFLCMIGKRIYKKTYEEFSSSSLKNEVDYE